VNLTHNFVAAGWALAYLAANIAMLGVFIQLYVWVTPYDELSDIRAGKITPMLSLGGAMFGFTITLCASAYVGVTFGQYIAWAVGSSILQFATFKFMYWLFPHQIEDGNLAAGIFYLVTPICVGFMIAVAITP